MTRQVSRGVGITARIALATLALTAAVAPAYGQAPQVAVPAPRLAPAPIATAQEMRQRYLWSTLGAPGVLHALAFGSYDQWRAHPNGWDQSAGGLARRVGSSYARSAISDASKYTVARALHQDPSFARCECSGVMRRLVHAIEGPLVARNRNGATVLSPATVTGIFTGHLVSAAMWLPAPFGATDVARRTGVSTVLKMGMDVFREFRPRRTTRASD